MYYIATTCTTLSTESQLDFLELSGSWARGEGTHTIAGVTKSLSDRTGSRQSAVAAGVVVILLVNKNKHHNDSVKIMQRQQQQQQQLGG